MLTRSIYALRRSGIPLSMPAHAVFLTEDSWERSRENHGRGGATARSRSRRVELFHSMSVKNGSSLAEHLHYAPFAANEVMTHQGP